MSKWERWGLGSRLLATMLLAASLLAGCGDDQAKVAPAPLDATFAAEQQAWRVQRLQTLLQPDGWTSLVGLHWLEWKAHYIGSGPGSGIRLAVGPAKLGMVGSSRNARDELWFTPEAGVDLRVGDAPVTGRIRFFSDADTTPTVIHFDEGKGTLSLLKRGDRYALRVKHADAPTRSAFAGLQYWDMDPSWRIHARYVPNDAGKTLPIVDMTGMTSVQPNAGAVEFERDGQTWRLEAIAEPGRPLLVIFADGTSGHGSYPAGRYLDVATPDANNQVVIDFNQAYNPPCAFTVYATCPLPPPENRMLLKVDAGEKNYDKPELEAS